MVQHPWLSDSYSAFFYIPCPLLGIPATHFFVAISLISFYALTIHTRFFNRPSFFIFTTPATHVLHHATNPQFIGKNLGAMFTVWDRLFGTYVAPEPAEAPKLGTTDGYQSYDGAFAQWHYPRRLWHAARQAQGMRDLLRVFFAHPGFLPAGATALKSQVARSDESIPVPLKAYVSLQFCALVAFSAWILWLRDEHSLGLLVAATLVILGAISTLGGLLDGRPRALRNELLRALATTIIALFVALSGDRAATAACALLALLSVASLSLVRRA